jgi:hypothetical protein
VAENQKMWMEKANVFKCLNSTLEVVEVNNFKKNVNVLIVLYYLISCGKVLKMVNINVKKGEFDQDEDSTMAYFHQIEEFFMTIPRASTDLQISVNCVY